MPWENFFKHLKKDFKRFKYGWLDNRKDAQVDKFLEHALNSMHHTYCILFLFHPIFL